MLSPAGFRELYPLTSLPDSIISSLAPLAEQAVLGRLEGAVPPEASVKAAQGAMIQHLYWKNQVALLSGQVGKEVVLEGRGRVRVTEDAVTEARAMAGEFLSEASSFILAAKGTKRTRRTYGVAR